MKSIDKSYLVVGKKSIEKKLLIKQFLERMARQHETEENKNYQAWLER